MTSSEVTRPRPTAPPVYRDGPSKMSEVDARSWSVDDVLDAVFFAIDTLGRDIRQHNRIRHRILLPMIDDESNSLSEREKDVLRLIVEGLTNKEIAARLYVSVNTVLTHRKNITAKLGIKTTPGLTFYAITHRLIPEVK